MCDCCDAPDIPKELLTYFNLVQEIKNTYEKEIEERIEYKYRNTNRPLIAKLSEIESMDTNTLSLGEQLGWSKAIATMRNMLIV